MKHRIILAAALCCLAGPVWADTAPITTWSPGPLYQAVEPFLVAIINYVVAPLLAGWIAYLGQRFLNIQVTNSQRAELQTTLANAAGRIVAQLEPAAMKESIPLSSPLIQAEVPKVEEKAKQAIDFLGITPDRVAEGIQGHIGRLQAPATTAPIVVPVIDAAGKAS